MGELFHVQGNWVVLGAERTGSVIICLGLITQGSEHPLGSGLCCRFFGLQMELAVLRTLKDQRVAYELEIRQFS